MKARLGLLLLVWQAFVYRAEEVQAASDSMVALEYDVSADAKGCPDVATFRTSVARQLGYDPFRPISNRRVAVQIIQSEQGFTGVIRWSDADGRWVGDRRLASHRQDCKAFAADLAFSVAVQIQFIEAFGSPGAAPNTPIPAPAPAPPTPTPPKRNEELAQPAVTLSPTPPAAPRPNRLRLSLGVGPSLALGLLPRTTPLGGLFVNGQISRFSLEAALDVALPSDQRQGDGSGFSVDRFAVGVAGCGHAQVFAACLTATLGLLRARGFGIDQPASPIGFFSQAGARLTATHDVGNRYFVQARLDGLVILAPWSVTVNETIAWTTPRVGAVVGVELGARLLGL